jgi:hypothetical protein
MLVDCRRTDEGGPMVWTDDLIRTFSSLTELFLPNQESLYQMISDELVNANLLLPEEIPTARELLGISIGVAVVLMLLGFYGLIAGDVSDAFYSIPAEVRPWALVAIAALAGIAIVGNPQLFRQTQEAYFEVGLVSAKAAFLFGSFSAGSLAARNPLLFVFVLIAGVGGSFGLQQVDLVYTVAVVVVLLTGFEVARYFYSTAPELGPLMILGLFVLTIVGGAFEPNALRDDEWHRTFSTVAVYIFPLGFSVGFLNSSMIGDYIRENFYA